MNTPRCDSAHSGNHTLHRTAGGWWQCAGCGRFYGVAPVAPIIDPGRWMREVEARIARIAGKHAK
mgnify:CR=1 FL=1